MSEEMLDSMDQIYANANRLVGAVAADQWESATPCSEWDVRQLVNHMTGTSRIFEAAATRSQPTGGPDADNIGDDPVGAFAAASQAATTGWRQEGAVEGMVSVPAEMPAMAALGVTILDIGTHCWDLAEAIGAEHGLSGEHIAMIDQWNHQVVGDEVRAGGGFGDVLEPQADDDMARMLAFVGRRL